MGIFNKYRSYQIPFLIIFCTFFMGFGYAAFNSITGEITGTVSAEVPEGVFISNIEYDSGTNVDLNNSSYALSSTTLANKFSIMPEATSFSVKYLITVYNNSDNKVAYDGFTCDEEFGDNDKINMTVESISRGDSVEVNDDIKFYVTISAKSGADLSAGKINSYINFMFVKQYDITYEEFSENNYPTTVMETEQLSISFGEKIWAFEVRMGGILLTQGTDYQYTNYVFTISDVTADLVITNLSKYTITFVTNGGSAVSQMRVAKGDEYTLPIPTKAKSVHMGWFLDSEFGTRFPNSGTYNYSEDITLYSRWGIVYDNLATNLNNTYVIRDGSWLKSTEIIPNQDDDTLKLKVIDEGYDPYIAMEFDESIPIDTNEYKYVVVGYQLTNGGGTNSSDLQMAIYADALYNDGSEKFPAGKVTAANIINDDYYEANVYDFSNVADFQGVCQAVRIDYFNATYATIGAYMNLYSVEFYKTAEDAVAAAAYIRTIKNTSKYTITFNTNGGASLSSMQVTYGEEYTLPIPTKANSMHAGWYVGSVDGTRFSHSGTYKYAGDLVLYSRWGLMFDNLINNQSTRFNIPLQNVSPYTFVQNTEVTSDSNEGALKLVATTGHDPFVTVEFKDYIPIDAGEYKYVVVGYRVPTSIDITGIGFVLYPFLYTDNDKKTPSSSIVATAGLSKSDTHQSAEVFDFSSIERFKGDCWAMRVDYFSGCQPNDYFYLHSISFYKTAEEAEAAAEAIETFEVN